jgi:hypothetical protein
MISTTNAKEATNSLKTSNKRTSSKIKKNNSF